MNYFLESNNNIDDVPMKFQDRYLQLLSNISIFNDCDSNEDDDEDDDDDESIDIEQYQVTDYKFDPELIAIEMFELNEKRKAEQMQQLENRKKELADSAMAYQQQKQMPVSTSQDNDNWQSKVFEESQQPQSQPQQQCPSIDNQRHGGQQMLYNFVSTEILKPIQPSSNNMNNDQIVSYDSANSLKNESISANKMENDNMQIHHHQQQHRLLVNPKEFENDNSSPFDNVELQSIDELKELNQVFGALSFQQSSASAVPQAPRNSPIQQQLQQSKTLMNHETMTTVIPSSATITTALNNYLPYHHTNYTQMMTTTNSHHHYHHQQQQQQNPFQHSPTHMLVNNNNHNYYHVNDYYQSQISTIPTANLAYSFVSNPNNNNNLTQSTMASSSSSINSLSCPRSKSVSDLTKLSASNNIDSNAMIDNCDQQQGQQLYNNHYFNDSNFYTIHKH